MLHITNGDSVAGTLRDAGFGPDIVAWQDVLHEGPVPAGLPLAELSEVRAGFIGDSNWASRAEAAWQFTQRDAALLAAPSHDETVLWFEHDLYDQLQLLQVLDWFAGQGLDACRVSLICNAEYLGPLDADALRVRFPARRPVSGRELNLARDAWAAFRSPDPRSLLPFLDAKESGLPFLGAALRRHLQQFPDARSGLSRSEAQAMAAICGGAARIGDAYFESHHKQEPAVFLGDSVFVDYLVAMSREPSPLILLANGERLASPGPDLPMADVWNSEVVVTNAGQAMLAGLEDRVLVNGIDRWLGGVHLQPGNDWRWKESKGVIARSQ